MIDHWEGGKRGGWLACSERANALVIPRRGAHALLYELRHPGEDPFDLDDEAFQKMSEPEKLDPQETAASLRLIESRKKLGRASLVIEALVGPSAVLEELCSIAEARSDDSRDSGFRGSAVDAALPLLRRVPKAEVEAIKRRFLAIDDDKISSAIGCVTDPLALAQQKLHQGKPQYALPHLCWVDEQEELLVQAYDARDQLPAIEFPDIPSPWHTFTGGPALIDRELANIDKYDSRDVGEAYINHYTSVRSPKLLPIELDYLDEQVRSAYPGQDTSTAMKHWLRAHASELAPWLRTLSDEPAHRAKAERALQLLADMP
jgi:hypothetical protein